MNCQTLLIAKAISERLRVTYYRAPTIWRYLARLKKAWLSLKVRVFPVRMVSSKYTNIY